MQKITVKSIELTTGTNEKGEWVKTQITSQDGAKMSSFDKKASELKEGDIIEGEIEVKGKYTNLKEWKFISSAPANPMPQSNSKMTQEQWAEKDRIERSSIEAQVAFKGIVELISTNPDASEPRLVNAYHLALEWAIKKLGGEPYKETIVNKEKPAQKSTTVPEEIFPDEERKEKTENKIPATPGELCAWCLKHGKQYNASWVAKEANVKSATEIKNVAEIYQTIKQMAGWTD